MGMAKILYIKPISVNLKKSDTDWIGNYEAIKNESVHKF